MNSLFDEEIRGHHSMRDHLLTVVSDADLGYKLPGQNRTLGEQLIEMGDIQGVYTHSFETAPWTGLIANCHRRSSSRLPACKPGSGPKTMP